MRQPRFFEGEFEFVKKRVRFRQRTAVIDEDQFEIGIILLFDGADRLLDIVRTVVVNQDD